MGQRGAKAAFMPNKFVFPGGAVDAADHSVALSAPLNRTCAARLTREAAPGIASACAVAAIREVWEETGLILGEPGPWPDPPKDWAGFAATGHRPAAGLLQFIFRAVTPVGRPRRFDARFFLAPAEALASPADDFRRASGELSNLQWVPVAAARSYNLPFITEVVLAELGAILARDDGPASVPFVQNDDPVSSIRRLT